MIREEATDLTAQRLGETEAAIREQRRYLESLTDPTLKTIAARTLTTLEDMLLIMKRTHRLLAETRDGVRAPDARSSERAGAPEGARSSIAVRGFAQQSLPQLRK